MERRREVEEIKKKKKIRLEKIKDQKDVNTKTKYKNRNMKILFQKMENFMFYSHFK